MDNVDEGETTSIAARPGGIREKNSESVVGNRNGEVSVAECEENFANEVAERNGVVRENSGTMAEKETAGGFKKRKYYQIPGNYTEFLCNAVLNYQKFRRCDARNVMIAALELSTNKYRHTFLRNRR